VSKTRKQEPTPKPSKRQLKRRKQWEAMERNQPPEFPLPEMPAFKPMG